MVPEWVPVYGIGIAATFLLGFGVVYSLDRPNGEWSRHLRSRLVLGVPWGTLIAVGFVACVYLFVQGGIQSLHDPVVLPFRAWSYFYPEGILWAGFSHANFAHVTGNLLATLVAGSLAEYAWGHFPRGRGRETFSSAWTNPYVRAFLIGPTAIVLAGLVTTVFSVGPVIGFSGVVFALWGFSLIHYPLGTVIALAGARVVRLVWEALQTPVLEASASSSFSTPWWAGIAIQGHTIGLFIGVLTALILLRHRNQTPGALRMFVGVVLFAVSRSLWAVYWFRGGETYVLFRAVGVGLVVVLAALIAAAVAAPGRPLFETTLFRSVKLPRLSSGPGGSTISPQAAAFVLLLVGAAAIAGPAVPVNLQTTAENQLPGDPIEVEGYEVTYVENIQSGMVSVIEVDAFGESTAVNTSGVIVRDVDRHLWATAVSQNQLAFRGETTVELGGTGWRETVGVRRYGWTVAGGNVSYRVVFSHNDQPHSAFVADPVTAEPTVDGRTVTIAAVSDGFELRVGHDGTLASAPVLAQNESIRLNGVTLSRQGTKLFASRGDTRVRVATVESYQGQKS